MPCRYDPTPAEIEAGRQRQAEATQEAKQKVERRVTASKKQVEELEAANNALSVRVDYLQDLIWRIDHSITVDGKYPDDVENEIVAVLTAQAEHRQADLDRIVRALAAAETIDYERLSKALMASPDVPLEPQLGFDPDSI